MVNDPDIILADEPTGALDPRLAREVFALLKSINKQGKTVIIATHNPIIKDYCNNILQLVDGRIA